MLLLCLSNQISRRYVCISFMKYFFYITFIHLRCSVTTKRFFLNEILCISGTDILIFWFLTHAWDQQCARYLWDPPAVNKSWDTPYSQPLTMCKQCLDTFRARPLQGKTFALIREDSNMVGRSPFSSCFLLEWQQVSQGFQYQKYLSLSFLW